MRIVIFRSEVLGTDMPEFSFSPIDPDESKGVVGSGREPWKVVEVPYGSRVVFSQTAGESLLVIAGERQWLTALDVAEQFGE